MLNTSQNLLLIATVLALCVISLVHVFVFPVYGVRPRPLGGRTVAELEQSLCASGVRGRMSAAAVAAAARRARCPQDGVVTATQGGRLGNQLWEYASVWALARRTGLEAYVPRCIRQRLDQVFEALSVPTLGEIAHCPAEPGAFVPSLELWSRTNQSIVLPRYTALPELVLSWLPDLRQELTFRRRLRERSARVLAAAARPRNQSAPAGGALVFVGVHVRRTDYLGYLWRKHRAVHAAPRYFFHAMAYFEAKYPAVVFVVISDDPAWCVRQLATKPNVYVASRRALSSPGQDLAVMAACNHSIIDYGTFGVWGALLAGGETILYNVTHRSALRLADLLPHWHILS